MKKKSIALILAALMVVLCFALAACGGSGTQQDSGNNDVADVGGTSEDAAQGEEDGTTDAGEVEAVADLDYIKEKGKMVVGITIYEPMNYEDKETGELTGFDTEFALAVGEKLGVEIDFIEINWDRKFTELDSKEIDCVWNGMTITEEALLNSSVSDPYIKNAQVLVMKADKIDDYKDIESLKDLTFAAEAGSAGEKAIKDAGIENCTAVDVQAKALLEVSSGSADACVIDITMAKAMTGEGTSYANLAYGLEFSTEEYGIACRKGSDLTPAINEIMAEMKADGSLQALADKYQLNLAD